MLASVTGGDESFTSGSTIRRREVLHGRVWLEQPVEVVADDGEVLAVLVVDGDPLHFVALPRSFDGHPDA
jgi:hypothetical protein